MVGDMNMIASVLQRGTPKKSSQQSLREINMWMKGTNIYTHYQSQRQRLIESEWSVKEVNVCASKARKLQKEEAFYLG
ncbi:sulfurtransferase TusC [Sesbania bispinosa]|nr:sulfurtransferase TusC [Sesbania bispinosa]